MAASQQADDVPARLEAVRQSLHTVAGTVLFIGSTVMSPDGPQEEVAQDTALERAVRGQDARMVQTSCDHQEVLPHLG